MHEQRPMLWNSGLRAPLTAMIAYALHQASCWLLQRSISTRKLAYSEYLSLDLSHPNFIKSIQCLCQYKGCRHLEKCSATFLYVTGPGLHAPNRWFACSNSQLSHPPWISETSSPGTGFVEQVLGPPALVSGHQRCGAFQDQGKGSAVVSVSSPSERQSSFHMNRSLGLKSPIPASAEPFEAVHLAAPGSIHLAEWKARPQRVNFLDSHKPQMVHASPFLRWMRDIKVGGNQAAKATHKIVRHTHMSTVCNSLGQQVFCS